MGWSATDGLTTLNFSAYKYPVTLDSTPIQYDLISILLTPQAPPRLCSWSQARRTQAAIARINALVQHDLEGILEILKEDGVVALVLGGNVESLLGMGAAERDTIVLVGLIALDLAVGDLTSGWVDLSIEIANERHIAVHHDEVRVRATLPLPAIGRGVANAAKVGVVNVNHLRSNQRIVRDLMRWS